MTSDVSERGGQGPWHASPAHLHLVQFYESDAYLLEMLEQFVATTLQEGEAGIVVATEPHLRRLRLLLAEHGIDDSLYSATGQLSLLDATGMMQQFMVNAQPDPVKFQNLFGPVIAETRERWPSVRIFGEMVALTAERNQEKATRDLEELWNSLQITHDFSLCCAYPMSIFSSPESANLLRDVCEQHSAVFPAEGYSTLKSDEDRFREITLLQQKATQLETEVQHRAKAEEQLRNALEAERAAREEAETALRLRDEFVSIAAHELKTPLTSLMGRAQLALKRSKRDSGQDPEQITHLVESVVVQAGKLSRLIGQLLDVSRLKGGTLSIERQLVDVVSLLEESVRSVDNSINNQTITIEAPETLLAEIDPIRLEQVIVNLLNNALKYSPRGSEVVVTLAWQESGCIELSVRDQGPGIPVAERDRIFERFYQVGQQSSPGGMGLGLYICREIVELHGGDVLAEFPESGGTRFIVRLPISSSQPLSQPHFL
jgi:signal transduction histidine kinase